MQESPSATVLIVDGDDELRRTMACFLGNSGCNVLEARNAYDALFLVAQHGPAIDLLVTEINLLPVGGIKLAENALRLWPRMQVIFISANTDMRGVRYWMRYLNAEFLAKPFSPFQLHEKVFSVLADRWEAATPMQMPVSETEPVAMRSSNDGDPMFWLKDF